MKMPKPHWYAQSIAIDTEFLRRAQSKNKLTTSEEQERFYALAIAGEAGELANLYKKQWRGDEIKHDDVVQELADIRIYLEHLARVLHVDLDEACEVKLAIVQGRLDHA
jgi:NTP pyrophosphatase (non-canonical NTP hydrolase)